MLLVYFLPFFFMFAFVFFLLYILEYQDNGFSGLAKSYLFASIVCLLIVILTSIFYSP